MNVKIKETGKIGTLSIIDRESGVNWVQDLIGNTGALHDGRFTWSEEDNAYLVDQAEYDWWAKYIADQERTEQEVEALADELDIDADIIWERIEENTGGDYEDHRGQAIQAMNDIRDELAQSPAIVAQAIYMEVYGAIDDKFFKAEKVGEMETWIKEGGTDLDTNNLTTLISEWREYDAEEIERRGV
jgi:hypothetical protein